MRYHFNADLIDSNPYGPPVRDEVYPPLWLRAGDLGWVDANNHEGLQVVNVEEDTTGCDVYTFLLDGAEYVSYGYTGSKPG